MNIICLLGEKFTASQRCCREKKPERKIGWEGREDFYCDRLEALPSLKGDRLGGAPYCMKAQNGGPKFTIALWLGTKLNPKFIINFSKYNI